MRLLYSCFLILLSSCLLAQKRNTYPRDTVYRFDTINVKGIVYGYDGKPLKNTELQLWEDGGHAPGYPETTKIDTNGYFEFKGLIPQGSIKFLDGRYEYTSYQISRYMSIYLPKPQVVSVYEHNPIIITAPKKYPKITPAFKVQLTGNEGTIFPNYDIYYPRPTAPYNGTKLIDYIKQNLVYPEQAIRNNIEGEVEIGFEFEKDGSLTNFKILKGIGYGCDEEVIELMKKVKFSRGIYMGKPVMIQETITVQFKLTDN